MDSQDESGKSDPPGNLICRIRCMSVGFFIRTSFARLCRTENFSLCFFILGLAASG